MKKSAKKSAASVTATLALLFQGAMALSGLTLAILALWGVFFTSIPERLIAQLHDDVAATQGELTALRSETGQLRNEVRQSQLHLSVAEAEKAQSERALVQLEGDIEQARIRLRQLTSDSEAYFDRLLAISAAGFFARIRSMLRPLKVQVEMVRTLPDAEAWIAARGTLDEIDIQRRPGEWRDAYDRWQKSMPAEWDNLLFLFSYSESGDGGFESMIVDFKNSVSQGPENSVPSGRALFEKALAEEGFELLLLAERERMIATIEEFLADHPNEFSQALGIMLEQGSTAQEFAGGAVRVQHNLDVFTELLDELHNQILNGRHGVKSP